MLTTSQINEIVKRRTVIILSVIFGALAAMFLYFFIVMEFREDWIAIFSKQFGPSAREWSPVLLIPPALIIFLTPLMMVDRCVKRFLFTCPHCHQDITERAQLILKTKLCPECGVQILEGRSHSDTVFERYCNLRSLRFLRLWLWAWPVIAALNLLASWIFPSVLRDCPNCLFLPQLIGFTAAGWASARTWDRRYVPQTVCSFALLVLGCYMYWRTF